jgi:phage tail tape-measure protein
MDGHDGHGGFAAATAGAARGSGGRMKRSLLREFGQSLYLIGLMAFVLVAYVGLGLLAVRFLA